MRFGAGSMPQHHRDTMTTGAARPRVLVLRHHGLGDLMTVQPALHALRRRFFGHALVVTCPSWLVPLAAHLGTADQLVSEMSARAPRGPTRVDPSRHQRVDAALLANVLAEVQGVDVLVSLRTPGPELMALVRTLAPRLFVSYRCDGLPVTAAFPELDFNDHILTRWRRLLGAVGIDQRDADLYADMAVPDSRRGFTVVHIGAGSPARLWPLARWVEVIGHLEATGHRVVLTGSIDEVPRVAEACRRAGLPADRNRSGSSDIMDLAHLVAGARLVVCVDTGVSHLATAFRRPAVTLFGPVPPAWWGPPPGNPRHRCLWTGRTGDNYGSATDPGLMEISVECVLRTIDDLHGEGV